MYEKDQPKYIKTAFALKEYIKDNGLSAGCKLPGGRKLGKMFNVSHYTIYDTLELLQSEGVVIIQPNSGTYIAPTAHNALYNKSPDWSKYIDNGWQVGEDDNTIKLYKKASRDDTVIVSMATLDESFGFKKVLSNCLSAIAKSDDLVKQMTTYAYQGSSSLRNSLTGYLKQFDIDTNTDNIVLYPGLLGAFEVIIKSFLRAGMVVYMSENAVEYQYQLLKSMGVQIVVIPNDENGLDFEYLKNIHRYSSHAMLVTCTINVWRDHNVPVGNVSQELLEWCQEQRMLVVEFDMDGALIPDHKTLKSMDKYDNVIYVGALPRYIAYGINVAWTVSHRRLTGRLSNVLSQTYNYPNNINYAIINELIKQDENGNSPTTNFLTSFREQLPNRIKYTENMLTKHLSSHAKWVCNKHTGLFVLIFDSATILDDFEKAGNKVAYVGTVRNGKSFLSLLSCSIPEQDLFIAIKELINTEI